MVKVPPNAIPPPARGIPRKPRRIVLCFDDMILPFHTNPSNIYKLLTLLKDDGSEQMVYCQVSANLSVSNALMCL